MMRLFVWECRRVLQSAAYWVFTVALVLFLYSQDALPITEGGDAFVRPQPGDEQQQLVPSGDPALIMPQAAAALLDGWQRNSFTTYPPPLCVWRPVTLSADRHGKLGQLLQGLYGQPADALASADAGAPPALRAGLTWGSFTDVMRQADRLLGGGSDWATGGLSARYGFVPATYEDLLAEYEACMLHDRYTGAYARLFCDYAAIALALFGALPSVALFLQDFGHRRGVCDTLWVRRCSSAALVCARMAALAFLQFIPVLVMDGALTLWYARLYGVGHIALGAFLRYSVLWLLPTLLLAVAGGAAVTLATGSAAGAAIGPALGWLSVTATAGSLSDGSTYGSLLTPRHNTVGKFLVYQRGLPRLLAGRAAALALAGLLGTAAVAALRRRRRGAAFRWRSGR